MTHMREPARDAARAEVTRDASHGGVSADPCRPVTALYSISFLCDSIRYLLLLISAVGTVGSLCAAMYRKREGVMEARSSE